MATPGGLPTPGDSAGDAARQGQGGVAAGPAVGARGLVRTLVRDLVALSTYEGASNTCISCKMLLPVFLFCMLPSMRMYAVTNLLRNVVMNLFGHESTNVVFSSGVYLL